MATEPHPILNTKNKTKEFAARMIMDGIMSLEMISRLTELDIKTIQELAKMISEDSGKNTLTDDHA